MRVVNVRLLNLPLFKPASKIRRVMKIAVKNEVRILTINVVAKPLIGPVPYTNRMKPVIIVVKFESKIAEKAPHRRKKKK